MKKTILYLAIIILASFFLATCEKQQKKYTIGVSQLVRDPWRDKFVDELHIGNYNYDNVDLKVMYGDLDTVRQASQIRQMISEGVDLLIVCPDKIEDLKGAIGDAMKADIPVIVFGRRPGDVPCTAFFVADYYDAGHAVGEFICRSLNFHGNVIEIEGPADSQSAIRRHKSFIDVINKYPGIRLLASVQGDWSEEGGARAIEQLSAYIPAADFVFAANDQAAYGAYRQMKRMGVKNDSLRFCGIDGLMGENGGVKMVDDGILAATYLNPTQGVEVMKTAMDIIEGRRFKKANYQESALVTRYNAHVMLMQNDEMQKQIGQLNDIQEKRENALNYISRLNTYLTILGILVTLLVCLVVAALCEYVNKVKLNRQLRESNERQQQLTSEIKELTKNQMQFFTNVSHELRTPLTLISAPVEQLYADDAMPERYKSTIDIIHRNVNVLVQQINDILDFRRVQNCKAKLYMNRFNLADSLREWSENFLCAADNKGIILGFDMDNAGDGEVIADRDKMAHIYFNLMSNAIKYTSSGGHIVTHVEKCVENGIDSYRISVEDDGVGMSKETCQHIFERFYQAEGTSGGTGIGLHLAKSYVDMHNGKMSVESQPGKGTTFHIILPSRLDSELDASENDENITFEVPIEQYMDKNIDRRSNLESVVKVENDELPIVLVVDDNNDMRQYLKTILGAKYDVVEACDGTSGLSKAKKTVPALIISDIMMPVMDGLELCRRLKESPATSHIPVMLLTAKTVDDAKKEGYQSGADSYITKPFRPNILLSRVDNLLKSREQLQKYFTANMNAPAELSPIREAEQPFIIQLRDIIRQRLDKADLSVEEIGDELHLSRVQLYRKVKALTGQSPVEIIRKSRLNHARHLLETTDKPITEILYEVGFSNSSYFAKCYKEEFGKTPSEVR